MCPNIFQSTLYSSSKKAITVMLTLAYWSFIKHLLCHIKYSTHSSFISNRLRAVHTYCTFIFPLQVKMIPSNAKHSTASVLWPELTAFLLKLKVACFYWQTSKNSHPVPALSLSPPGPSLQQHKRFSRKRTWCSFSLNPWDEGNWIWSSWEMLSLGLFE